MGARSRDKMLRQINLGMCETLNIANLRCRFVAKTNFPKIVHPKLKGIGLPTIK